MSARPSEQESVALGRLDDRVLVALEEMNGRIAFSGLRRTLGAHPESLSRALRRLEREGLIERSEQGYRSTRHPDLPSATESELHAVARIEIHRGSRLTPCSLGSLADGLARSDGWAWSTAPGSSF